MIGLGSAFWGGIPNDPNGKHLHFIITDPQLHGGKAVMVNATTQRRGRDSSCVLSATDHPDIRHDSVINYLEARVVEVEKVEIACRKHPEHMHLTTDASDELLDKILHGAEITRRISPECLELVNEQICALDSTE